MTNCQDLNRILKEYYADKDPEHRIRDWVKNALLSSGQQHQQISTYSAAYSMTHKNCWIVFDPISECFLISRDNARICLDNQANYVRLTLDDYLTASYGIASLNTMRNQVVLSGPEVMEIVEEIVDDLHGWCSLLDGVRDPPNP